MTDNVMKSFGKSSKLQRKGVSKTQKPTEGTGLKNLISLEEIPMSKVVYRGVEYDTEKRIQYQQQMMQQPQQYNENYRGVKFVKEGHK
jgi:hypothetical protein